MIQDIKLIDNKLIIKDEQFAVEKKLMEKLRYIAEDVTDDSDQNAFIINHGTMGSGKTNSSVVEGVVLSILTNREIDLYFKLQGVLDFAKNNSNKLIIWDEPAFTSLAQDHAAAINKDLLRLINTSRLKRHVIIINFTKFWRFPIDVVVDTPRFFINMSSKDDEKGRFLYIPQERLENLWNDYQRDRQKNYVKYKRFGGKMPFIYKKYFSKLNINVEGIKQASYDDYLRLRDKAVSEIGNKAKLGRDELKKHEARLRTCRAIDILKDKLEYSMTDACKLLGISPRLKKIWEDEAENRGVSLEKQHFKGNSEEEYLNTMDSETDDDEKEANQR